MKKGHILHNPKAGSQEKSKKDLVKLMENNGFEWGYSSTKKIGWKRFHSSTDFLVVAGGDGTVRKVATKLIEKDRFKKSLPILLLPLGTANNIAKSIGIEGHVEEIVRNISTDQKKKFDVGRMQGVKEQSLFLESFGFGIFPQLMKRMREIPEPEEGSPEQNLAIALEQLLTIVKNAPAHHYKIKIDDVVHSGNYLLVEVMNTPSFGPNLNLSPDSDPGDGEFELVMVPERERKAFADYVSHKINGIEKPFKPVLFKGRNINISAGPGPLHIDDELIELKKSKKIRIRPEAGMMEFFVQ